MAVKVELAPLCSKEFRESAAGDSWKELPASKVWNTTLE